MTTDSSHPLSRRSFLTQAGAGSVGLAAANLIAAAGDPKKKSEVHGEKWPHEARLAISISMQFEAGGQPDFGADSPFSIAPVPEPYPDLPARTWFKYGHREGVPRLLDLWDKHGIKVTSHMVGGAARKNPQLAKEIVDRGHEAAAHGMTWQPEFAMSREDLKTFISDGVKAVFDATGQQTIGYNANWLHRSVHTLPVLQELGFLYHVDDLSHDKPTLVPVNGQDFVVVPYTIRNNDIMLIEGRHFSSGQFLEQLKHEFDQLYAEGATRRRQMSISTHDRIGGTPAMVRVMDEFLTYAKSHPGVWFARKDEIARFAKQSPLTPRDSDET